MRFCMNWDAINFDWNQVRAFLATAETGSLSAAARALHQTQPTLGRQVAALEHALGVSLFERVGRGLNLTPTGHDLLDHVRTMGEAATRVSLIAAGRSESVSGKVSISVADSMAIYVMPDILAELATRAPEIEIELVVTNALSDLLRHEADIALRHVRPQEPDLVTKLIREGAGSLYAAPSFLRRYGRPVRIEELADLPIVGMASPEVMVREMRKLGLPARVENIKFHSSNSAVAWEMVRRGLGVGIMADDVAAQTPDLERILPAFKPLPVQLWLTTHRELRTSARIRVVYDFLAEALKG